MNYITAAIEVERYVHELCETHNTVAFAATKNQRTSIVIQARAQNPRWRFAVVIQRGMIVVGTKEHASAVGEICTAELDCVKTAIEQKIMSKIVEDAL